MLMWSKVLPKISEAITWSPAQVGGMHLMNTKSFGGELSRVYKEWKSTGSKPLRDMVWKATDEEITEWMPTELKKRVQALREADAFKKRKTSSAATSDTHEEFERLKAQASQAGTEVDDDELFLQAVGGKSKKRTIYGLGTESEAYYLRSGRRSSPSSLYTPSVDC
ncbi:hypothetical protein Cgig2_001561 [Carnegiea gigantea]|uniref:Uncharacterized protein n=1 Tax=Carnegiea gigantea TaxID=171969 RepID=A0A9Q1K136_9CARY|nr:hypothetical protein Cgig2_001561 [Carnegiea gigantea]